MNRVRWSALLFCLLCGAAPAEAITLSPEAEASFLRLEWRLATGTVVLLVSAAVAMWLVMLRPRGARFWEAVLVVVGLGAAWVAWVVVCGLTWWHAW